MRVLGFILAGCVALAVLRAIMWAGAVLWGLLLLYALIRHPKELLSFVGLLTLLSVTQSYPGIILALTIVVLLAIWAQPSEP